MQNSQPSSRITMECKQNAKHVTVEEGFFGEQHMFHDRAEFNDIQRYLLANIVIACYPS